MLFRNKVFSIEDVQILMGITRESSRVLCCRNVRSGFLVRLKNNMYVLQESWQHFTRENLMRISNILQVPSYVSFMTALFRHGMTTQVPRNYIECAAVKRTREIEICKTIFQYHKLSKKYYFGFAFEDDLFIASREKAFVDSIYLYSLGRYAIDLDALDLGRLEKKTLKQIIRVFPQKTRQIVSQLCGI